LLYSKNEQKYRVSGKELKKREHDEANVLEFVEEKITKNNFKMEIDLTDKGKKSKINLEKKNTKNRRKTSRTEAKMEEKLMMVNIMDILYDISKTFIFHNDWELRHGALIYIRAFSRAFKKNKFTTSIPKTMLTPSELKMICEFVVLTTKKNKDKEEFGKLGKFI
jgi:hypothetical protein